MPVDQEEQEAYEAYEAYEEREAWPGGDPDFQLAEALRRLRKNGQTLRADIGFAKYRAGAGTSVPATAGSVDADLRAVAARTARDLAEAFRKQRGASLDQQAHLLVRTVETATNYLCAVLGEWYGENPPELGDPGQEPS